MTLSGSLLLLAGLMVPRLELELGGTDLPCNASQERPEAYNTAKTRRQGPCAGGVESSQQLQKKVFTGFKLLVAFCDRRCDRLVPPGHISPSQLKLRQCPIG